MAPPAIKDLLEEPFGPYPDYFILDPTYKPQGTNLPQLKRLRLERDRQPIGLDTSERYLDSSTDTHSSFVSIFGVLVIDNLAWLSPAGRILITGDLNERDKELSGLRPSQNSRKSTHLRELRLETLYGKTTGHGGFKIKLWICCQKENAAMFLTAKDYPASLVINSRDQHRSYEILSLDKRTYDLSRNFLERYRLVALISEIMANDAYHLSSQHTDDTSEVEKLEVENFITAYLLQHRQNFLSYAVMFASEDNQPANPALRHISRAEIRSIFAAHCGWLLAFYLRAPKNKCPIDIRSWCEFIRKVRIAKGTSASRGWGETYDDDDIWDPEIIWDLDNGDLYESVAKTLAKFGGAAADWKKRLTARVTNSNVFALFSSESPEPPSRRFTRRSRRALNYDPDFSPESTPGCSDSEYDSDSVSPPFSSPRVLLHMSQPPVLLPGRFIWDCPIPNCEHSIDLLNLTRQDIRLIQPDAFQVYLKEKQYHSLRDENVERALCQMVSHHYCHDHLGMDSANLTLQKQKLFMAELSTKWHTREPPPDF